MVSCERNIRNILLMCLMFFSVSVFGQMNITSSQKAQVLAQRIAGHGVTIFNAKMTCPILANGSFTITNSSIGFASGIVLTTGRAATSGSLYGINGIADKLASTDNLAAGDPELDALAGKRTMDACTLEFDVIPNGDTIQFKYIFSSEEYINSVCGPYNDAFAFFISGPGITGNENMALVPGTSIPVTINTINNGIPGRIGDLHNCTVAGSGSPFISYYVDNTVGKTITHEGMTKVMTAKHRVTPCNTYHLKISIADAGNGQYDSGVLLEANSLQTEDYNIRALFPSSSSQGAFCIKGCLPGHFRINRSIKKAAAQTIRFLLSGSASAGFDYAPVADSIVIPANDSIADIVINGLPTSPLGVKSLRLSLLSPYLCSDMSNVIDSASMNIYDSIHISAQSPAMVICKKDSVKLQISGDSILSYNWLPNTYLSDPHIQDPIAFPIVNTTYTVTASFPGSTCPIKIARISLNIKLTPDVTINADTTVCYNNNVQLQAHVADSNLYNSYLWAGPKSFTSTLSQPTIEHITKMRSGIYSVTVINDTNECRSTASIDVQVNTPGEPEVTSPAIICLNTTPTALTAKGTQLTWYDTTGQSSNEAPLPPTNNTATYSYYVSQEIDGCESPKARINIAVEQCCDGIINLPTAFTPNGDGRNDVFQPLMAYGYTIKSMVVINRWGQQVYSGTDGVWNGTFKGIPAEMGNYVYLIYFNCILGGTEVRKGDVTLIR